MSSIKANVQKNERAMLNTTIDKDVLDSYKAHCKGAGMPMNTVLETFMTQFVSGEFVLKIGKGNKIDIKDQHLAGLFYLEYLLDNYMISSIMYVDSRKKGQTVGMNSDDWKIIIFCFIFCTTLLVLEFIHIYSQVVKL